jgi:hypothetical protein
MKIWVDDVRPAPDGYVWCKSVCAAIYEIEGSELYDWVNENSNRDSITLIDIDYDAGEYAAYGGDYIKLLDWLEQTGRNYPIRIHSMNPVGVKNMRAIIKKNCWIEVN